MYIYIYICIERYIHGKNNWPYTPLPRASKHRAVKADIVLLYEESGESR